MQKQSSPQLLKADSKRATGNVKRERDEEVDEILASARSAKKPHVREVEIVDLLDD